MWRQQLLKILVASLCSSLIQCPTSRCDTTLKNVQDDKTVLITSGIRLRDDFSPRTYFRPSHTIFISFSYTHPIITFILPSSDWAIGSQAQLIKFQQYFLDNRPPQQPLKILLSDSLGGKEDFDVLNPSHLWLNSVYPNSQMPFYLLKAHS